MIIWDAKVRDHFCILFRAGKGAISFGGRGCTMKGEISSGGIYVNYFNFMQELT